MAISRSARIAFLLVIDVLFFFVELVVGKYRPSPTSAFSLHVSILGYAVGSLALVADSFHMLKCAYTFHFSSMWFTILQ